MVELAAGKNIYQSWNFMQRWSGANPKYFRYISIRFSHGTTTKTNYFAAGSGIWSRKRKKDLPLFCLLGTFQNVPQQTEKPQKSCCSFQAAAKGRADVFSSSTVSIAMCMQKSRRVSNTAWPTWEKSETDSGSHADMRRRPECTKQWKTGANFWFRLWKEQRALLLIKFLCLTGWPWTVFFFCTYGTYFDDDKSNCFFFRSFFSFSCKFWSICLR